LILLSVQLVRDGFILHKENFFIDCAQALQPLYELVEKANHQKSTLYPTTGINPTKSF
jgi:hypothetical protein